MTRGRPSLDHTKLWAAIDAIATRHGLSASGLARRAGLDATAFNKSKRHTGDGRPRWPSTESIAKILDATGTELVDLVHLIAEPAARPCAVGAVPSPVAFAPITRAGAVGFADDGGQPAAVNGAERTAFAESGESLYALEVTIDTLRPFYRPGDVLIVSPTVQIRPGDRVVVRTADGGIAAQVYRGHHGGEIELTALAETGATTRIATQAVTWLARILWASQ
ncbi:helix-turn-helix transcriptional regulator [Siculibacillus lacustris]|uniref:Helix-turn-helix transcriptional regulator n=1 Tax=Siculibacillus lacustris TaxID=1549641 RepID=A0A4Q9VQA8_9HYPH|nr:helix-turn-helix transcriptional regulator [Siculibacillus lacustris]TBW37147.1 helix-turn-helix transcriptional regulator [Siculibacillus lacustris]